VTDRRWEAVQVAGMAGATPATVTHAKRQFSVVSYSAFYFLSGFFAFIYFFPFFISLYLLLSPLHLFLYFLCFSSVLIFFPSATFI
jgi:hypothetical protein